MYNLKSPLSKILFNFFIVFSIWILFYFIINCNTGSSKSNIEHTNNNVVPLKKEIQENVWLIFTKVTEKSPLRFKFRNLLENILNISSIPLKFHIITDNSSKELAISEISDVVSHSNKVMHYKLYDVQICAKKISHIVEVMTPHFSSKPGMLFSNLNCYFIIFFLGTYYSDALFYISLGLHIIAPPSQTRALLLDCDLYFKKDIKLVFDEFKR